MPPNSDKQLNNYNSEGVYTSYQGTPLPPYSQQFFGGNDYTTPGNPYNGQTPLHQQEGIVITSAYQSIWRSQLPTPITPNLRMFLIISGFIYSLWGILGISLQIGIVVNSYSTDYLGFLTGAFFISGGIIMMVAAFHSHYPLIYLIRMYGVNLSFCIVELIVSIVNYATSNQCVSLTSIHCDNSLTSHLKVILLVVFSFALIHIIVNKIFISKHQRTVARENLNVTNH